MEKDRTGYQFEGWYVDENLTRKLNPGGLLPGNIELYPKWTAQKFPIYYELEEGVNSQYNPHEGDPESGIVKLYPAQAKDRQFVGWFLDGKRVDYLPDGIRQPIHLVGKFQDPVIVHFDTNGGARMKDQNVGLDGRLKTLPNPLRIGYSFDGWYLDENLKHRCLPDHDFLHSCTLYAKWRLTSFEVRYDLDEGAFVDDPIQSFTCLTPTFLLPKAQKEGFDFEGWFDERGNQHLMVRKGSINNRRLKARWTLQPSVTFKVSNPSNAEPEPVLISKQEQ